jgi:hypothetical protein
MSTTAHRYFLCTKQWNERTMEILRKYYFEIKFTNPNIWPKVKDTWWIINVHFLCEITITLATTYPAEVDTLQTILNK